MDPIESINFKKDTTLAILLAAQKRDCIIFYMRQSDLYANQGISYASMRPLSVFDNEAKWFELGEEQDRDLSSLDIISRLDRSLSCSSPNSNHFASLSNTDNGLIEA